MSKAKKSLFSGVLLVLDALMKKLIGLISTLILVRLLAPSDFGLIAIVMLVLGFVNIFSVTGSEAYIIQKKDVSNDTVNTAWSIDLVLKITVASFIFFSAPWVADYYEKPQLIDALQVISLMPIIGVISNPGLWLLKKEQKYTLIVKISVISKVVSVLVTISIALIYKNYWALIIGHLSSVFLRTIGSYLIHPYRPCISFKYAKEQWQFSGWMTPQAILGYIRTQLDTFLVSHFYGTQQLGSYHVMKYLSFMPSSEILGPATNPLLVELANVRDDKVRFNYQFRLSFLVTILLAFPMVGFLVVYSKQIVELLLGHQWLAFSDIFGALSLLVLSFVFFSQASRVLLVFEKTKYLFYYELGAITILYGYLLFIGLGDLLSFTLNRVFVENILCLLFFIVVGYFTIGVQSVFSLLLLLVPIGVSVGLSIYSSVYIDTGDLPVLFELIIKGGVFSFSYLFCLWLAYKLYFHKVDEFQYTYNLIGKLLAPLKNKLFSTN